MFLISKRDTIGSQYYFDLLPPISRSGSIVCIKPDCFTDGREFHFLLVEQDGHFFNRENFGKEKDKKRSLYLGGCRDYK